MKYLVVFAIFLVFVPTAFSQVAKISADGTAIYTLEGVQYEGNRPADNRYRKGSKTSAQNTHEEKQSLSAVGDSGDNLSAENPESVKIKKRMKNFGSQKTARNIMILREVAGFKLGDEQLRKDFAELEQNSQYEKKLQKIMQKLKNDKIRNSKNKEVLRILDEAGDKIYNLLSD